MTEKHVITICTKEGYLKLVVGFLKLTMERSCWQLGIIQS